MNEVLEEAIRLRRVVTFTYDGCFRVVEPFLLGTTKAGHPALRGFQIGGGSRSGRPVGWRLFVLGKIGDVTMSQDEFSGVRPGYNTSDEGMRTIGAHI